jgi:hypothetical protein
LINVLTGAPTPVDISSLLSGAMPPAAAPGSSLSAAMATAPARNTGAMSNEDLVRAIAAAGLFKNLNAPSASLLAAQLKPRNAAGSDYMASLLCSLAADSAAGTASRKREGQATSILGVEGVDGGAAARTMLQQLQTANKRQRLLSNDQTLIADRSLQVLNQLAPEAAAVQVLASAAAEMERKPAAAPVYGTLSPEGNSFPLPPEKELKKEGCDKTNRMPQLTSFQNAWDNVKSKDMRKEIFLRMLHAGKVPLSSQGLASKAAP